MKAHWWSCVLGLICMPVEVMLSIWTASQNPSSMSYVRVNSSAQITCSTSLSNPMGLYLLRHFHSNKDILYLALKKGQITKNTTAVKFVGRIQIISGQEIKRGYGFTLQLFQLGLEDTDLYYCSWTYVKSKMRDTLHSNGTVIIVTESGLQEKCKDPILDLTLIALSITAFTVVLFLVIGALILKCRQFRRHFSPARVAEQPRPNRPQHARPQQQPHHFPYLITNANMSDFRDIL